MIIEHLGISVSYPIKIAKWYEKNLGCKIQFLEGNDDGNKSVAFISDESNAKIIEFFKLPGILPLNNFIENPLQLHIAFRSEFPYEDSKRLIDEGATFLEECLYKHDGEILLLLKDPWGNTIQLVKR